MPEPTIIAADQGELLSNRPKRTVRKLCEHPLLDATWFRYQAGQPGPDPHVHHEHVDAFYVIDGELQFQVGPEIAPVSAPAGTLVLVPPNVIHTFTNASEASARWLNLHAPSTGFIAYVRGDRDGFDSDDPPADGGLPADYAIVAGPGAAYGRSPQLSASELEVEPGWELAMEGNDVVEAVYVLDGELEFVLRGRVVNGGSGTWLSALPGERPGVRNAGPGRARLLHVRAPGRSGRDA
jgi:quercetin dioxygenase-like cupin family protein